MGLIRLKSVPEGLHRRLKSEAAMAGVTLEILCIGKLEVKDGSGIEAGNEVVHDDTGRGRSGKAGSTRRGGDGAAMSVVQEAKGTAKRLHPVQPLRDKLDGRTGSVKGSSHEGHRVLPNGDKQWCSDCRVDV
jgi:hypothetical protein